MHHFLVIPVKLLYIKHVVLKCYINKGEILGLDFALLPPVAFA